MWSHITPHTSLWPEPRSSHTVCTMVCNDQEIKVLLIGGYGYKGVLSDCWLLDVMRGIGQKVRRREVMSEVTTDHWSVAI